MGKEQKLRANADLTIWGVHKTLCALVAVAVAVALANGQALWLLAATTLVLVMVGLALGTAPFRKARQPVTDGLRGPGTPDARSGGLGRTSSVGTAERDGTRGGARQPAATSRRGSRTPGFHEFLVHRLGDPREQPWHFLRSFFVRPLCAGSFAEFWRLWNPVYGYILLFFIYRPLRRHVPRPVAVYLAFLASGFLLHDLPFNLSADLSRGRIGIPAVTLLFAIFGALALVSEALRVDLSRFPGWVRVGGNLGWLGAAFGLHWVLLSAIRG